MKRLSTIVSYISSDDIVVDVGCDHGYLLELAINNKQIKKCYAVDNKIGPLNSARNNLKHYKNVEFVLSDGLISLNGDYNTVVIAGMGGMLINKIFTDSIEKFQDVNKVIVAPNKNSEKVRAEFTTNGFKIYDETIVYEDGIFYEIICFEKGIQNLTEKELVFGPINLFKKEPLFQEKWSNYYSRIKDIEAKEKEKEMILELLND